MYNKEDLLRDLRAMGIQKGDTLMVHSSVRSVGPLENRADTIVDALMEAVGEDGLLLMPDHTWAQMGPNYTVFDPETEPSCVGVLPDVLRARENVYRSLHPTHSVVAWGRDAGEYVKGEEFTNQLVEAISHGRTVEFRAKYRKVDMLLIDDIQFIAGKDATQTEFFHTFDALYEDHRQIILTSDRPPRELVSLEARIRSRFEQGLLVDIKPPDYELRLAILRNKVSQNRVDVPGDVVDFLAKNLQENIRQLEGVVKKLVASNLLTGQPVNMEMVLQTVPEYLQDAEPVSDIIQRIIAVTAKHCKVTEEDILGTSRKKNIQNARNIAMYVTRAITNSSLPQIGAAFDRDHSTVHSNINRVEQDIAGDPLLEAKVSEIMKEVKRGE